MPERDTSLQKEPRKENISNLRPAFVFSGQGAQFVGMGRELYDTSEAARAVFDTVNNALEFNLSGLILEGFAGELKKTVNSQPAIMTVSLAGLSAFQEVLGKIVPPPMFVAGHSLGQYTSLVAAGVLDLSDGVKLVRERGRLMQEASEKVPGGMGAILGLDLPTLEEICLETGVEIANINSPDQIIISGEKVAIARAMDIASIRGAKKTIPLAVTGAFHSRLMKPAEPGLSRAIHSLNLRDPRVPIIANSDSKRLTRANEVEKELVKGLCSRVEWRKSVESMVQLGVKHFIEFGPGNVLSGLVRQIDKRANALSINSPNSIQKLLNDIGV